MCWIKTVICCSTKICGGTIVDGNPTVLVSVDKAAVIFLFPFMNNITVYVQRGAHVSGGM